MTLTTAPAKLMGSGVRGFFAIGVYNPKTEINIGTLVRSARAMGATFVFTIGRRYQRTAAALKHERHIPVLHFDDLDDFRSSMPKNDDTRIVAVEIADGARPLATFCHPERAIYLLGAEDTGIPPEALKGCNVVQLPGDYCLNVAVAGSIVMYDRVAKRGVHGNPAGPQAEEK
jgi:tRNA G18 (ribose-2'-O)-methylase SpoU